MKFQDKTFTFTVRGWQTRALLILFLIAFVLGGITVFLHNIRMEPFREGARIGLTFVGTVEHCVQTEDGWLIYLDDASTEDHALTEFLVIEPDLALSNTLKDGKNMEQTFSAGITDFIVTIAVEYSLYPKSAYYYKEGMPYPAVAVSWGSRN